MLRFIDAKHGPVGAIRRYQHSKFGLIQTVTTWRDPGAHIVRIETERDREKFRAVVEKVRRDQSKAKHAKARKRK